MLHQLIILASLLGPVYIAVAGQVQMAVAQRGCPPVGPSHSASLWSAHPLAVERMHCKPSIDLSFVRQKASPFVGH